MLLKSGLRRGLVVLRRTFSSASQEAMMDEQCILVDANDLAVGQASKRVCHTVDPKTGLVPLHRAFSLFIFDRYDRLLVHQRSESKITFPGLWTNSCCSHPLATIPEELENGADSMGVKVAAQRRVLDELGIRPESCPTDRMTFLTRILYNANSNDGWGENELDHILFFKELQDHPIEVKPNPDEVKEYRFVAREHFWPFLDEIQDRGESITPWLRLIMRHRLSLWWENLQDLSKFIDREQIVTFNN